MRENKLQWCCAMSLMVLCRCLNVQHVMDLWPQLVQQCCPRFIAFLRDPGVDVTDDELLPPPPRPCSKVAAQAAPPMATATVVARMTRV